MDLSVKSNSSLNSNNMPCNLSKVTFRRKKKRRNRSSDTKDDSLKIRSNSLINENKSERANRELNVIPEESSEKSLHENLDGESHELPLFNLNNSVINQDNNNKAFKKIKHHKSTKTDDTPIEIFQNTKVGMRHSENMLNVESALHLEQAIKKEKVMSDDIQGSTVDNSKFWEKCTKIKQEDDNKNSTNSDKTFKTKAQHKPKNKCNTYDVSDTEDDSKQLNNKSTISYLGESFNMSLDSKPLQDRLTLIDKSDNQESNMDNSEFREKCTKRKQENDIENSSNYDKTKAQRKYKNKFNIYDVSGTEDDSKRLNNKSFLGESFNMSLDSKPLQDRLTPIDKSDNHRSVKYCESSHKKKKSKKRLKTENEELFNKTDCHSFLLEEKIPQINNILTPYNSAIDEDKAESKSENCLMETNHNDFIPSDSAPFNLQEDERELENKIQDFKTKVKHKRKKHLETESLQDRLRKTEKSYKHDTLKYCENIPKKKSKKKHKNKKFSNNTDCGSFSLEGNKPQINNNVTSCHFNNQDNSKLLTENFMTETDHSDLIPSGCAAYSLNLSNTQNNEELGYTIQTFKTKDKYKNKKKFNECQILSTKGGLKHLQNESFLEDDSNLYSESNTLKDRLNRIEESDKQNKLKSETIPKMKKSKKKLKASDEFLNNSNILTPFTSTINEDKTKLRSPEQNAVSEPNIMKAVSMDILSGSSQPNLSGSDVCIKERKNKAADFKKVCKIKKDNNKISKCLSKNLNTDKSPRKSKPLIKIKGTDVDKLRYQILDKYMKRAKEKNVNSSVTKPKQKMNKANLKSNKKAKSNDIDMIRQQLISKALKIASCSLPSKSSEIKTNVLVNPTQRTLPNAKTTTAPQYDTSELLLKSEDTKIQHVREDVSNTQQTFSMSVKNSKPKSSGKNKSHGKAEVQDTKSEIKGRTVDKLNDKNVHKDKTKKYVPSKKDEKTEMLSVEDMTSQLLAKVLAKVHK